MKRFRIVLPIFIGVAVYSILGICFGPRGLWSMSQLANEKVRLAANLESLYTMNNTLEARLDNLSADPDTISVYAHELGYIADGEHLIKLAGFSGGIDRKMVTGTALVARSPRFLAEWICKILGLMSGCIAFFLIIFVFSEKKHDHFQELF